MEAATTTTRPQPRESTLVHFEIPTNEPEKIARFYEQLFSWKIAKVPMGPMDYWLISHKDAGENETMGGLYKKTMGETGFLNHFSVVNIDQSLQSHESWSEGCKGQGRDPEHRMVRDPPRPRRQRFRPVPSFRQNVDKDSRTIPSLLFSSSHSGETGRCLHRLV